VHEIIHGLAHEIAGNPIEIFEGVPETLRYLAGRHHLILVTKGNLAEQAGKVERSGLKGYFAAVEIVAEKDPAAYRLLVEKYGLVKDRTWMVGNSPVSDINPALAIGLNAVFIPYAMTWVLEDEELRCEGTPGRLLVVERFPQLQEHF
jgi:putative hydrolase of the HAD superfamily